MGLSAVCMNSMLFLCTCVDCIDGAVMLGIVKMMAVSMIVLLRMFVVMMVELFGMSPIRHTP